MSRKKIDYAVLVPFQIKGKRYEPNDTVSTLDIPSLMVVKSWLTLGILGDLP